MTDNRSWSEATQAVIKGKASREQEIELQGSNAEVLLAKDKDGNWSGSALEEIKAQIRKEFMPKSGWREATQAAVKEALEFARAYIASSLGETFGKVDDALELIRQEEGRDQG